MLSSDASYHLPTVEYVTMVTWTQSCFVPCPVDLMISSSADWVGDANYGPRWWCLCMDMMLTKFYKNQAPIPHLKITNATCLLVAHNPELSIRRRGMFKVDSLKYSFTRLDVYFNIILHELKIDTNVQSWHQRLCMSVTISDVVYFLRRSLKRYQVVSFIVWLSSHFSCNNLHCG